MKNIRLDINGDIIDEIFGLKSNDKSRIEQILEDIVGVGQKKVKSKKKETTPVIDITEAKKKKSTKKKNKKVLHIKKKK